jgi:hypothetical protein
MRKIKILPFLVLSVLATSIATTNASTSLAASAGSLPTAQSVDATNQPQITIGVYFWVNGLPVDFTGFCGYNENHVYDFMGNILGYRSPENPMLIRDAMGNEIGFLAPSIIIDPNQ